MSTFRLNINGTIREVNADPSTPLLWILRDHLDLVGTKYGCGIAQCGACTVHLNGTAVRACQLPVASLESEKIITIEGLSEQGEHQFKKHGLPTMSPNVAIAKRDKLCLQPLF